MIYIALNRSISMKYPKDIEKKLPEIAQIVSSWPINKDLNEVLAWILQFDSNDIDIAIRIIRNLNVIGPNDLNRFLSIAYSKLKRYAKEKGKEINNDNTLYVTFGSAAKSGALVAYNFRCINGLSSAYFLSEDILDLVKLGKIKNLVLIDDIIASGGQSSALLQKVAEKAHSLNINNIYVLTAIGFREGIEKVASKQVAEVFSAVEYDKIDTVASLDCTLYDGMSYDSRESAREKLSSRYKILGYSGIGALIVFYYNTPNNTLGCIWNSSDGWIPLFERKTDMRNKGPELYTLDELVKNALGKDTEKPECNIYVEGKLEELFVQELANQNEQFGYGSVNVISIGPFYNKNLVTTLKSIAEKVSFVTTEKKESQTQHAKNILNTIDEADLTRMEDVMHFFDIEKIKESTIFGPLIDWLAVSEIEEEDKRFEYIENKLFNKYVSAYRISNMKELITNCATKEKINEFVDLVKKQ